MMYNYQNDSHQTGCLRLLTFTPERSLLVDSYSPWLDDHYYYESRREEEGFVIADAF